MQKNQELSNDYSPNCDSFNKYLEKKLTKSQIDIQYPPEYPPAYYNQQVNYNTKNSNFKTKFQQINHTQIEIISNQQQKTTIKQNPSSQNKVNNNYSISQQAYWTRRKKIFCSIIYLIVCIVIVLTVVLSIILTNHNDPSRLFCGWFSRKVINVSLTWNQTNADLDLFVKQPTGQQVYYDHKFGSFGQLQRDVRNGPGPQLYTAACTTMGTYTISAQYYDPKLIVAGKILIFAGDRNYTQYFQIKDDIKIQLAKIIVTELYGIGDFNYQIVRS